jgi:hypothetical protein
MAHYLVSTSGNYGAFTIIPLLKTMMIPSDHATEVAPDVGVSGVNAFINSITTSFTYDVKTDPVGGVSGAFTYTDVSSYASGMYLSLPQESFESMWHMGYVPPGASASVASGTYNTYPVAATARGLDMYLHYVGAQAQAVAVNAGVNYCGFKLTYVGELALPRVGPNNGITWQPSIPTNYSKVRAFAADFKMSSTTISGVNFNLNGMFHSGVIADTRFISQVQTDANAPRRAYPASALNQQSVTKPDDLRNSTVTKGAIDLMGPDYPRQWTSVDVDATDSLNAQWQTYPYTTVANPIVSGLSSTAVSSQGAYHIAQLWITPTDTELYVINKSNPFGVPLNWQKIYFGAINEDGVLDIDIGLRMSIAGNTAQQQDHCAWDYLANFVHVYAYIGADGLVRYNLYSETQKRTYTTAQSMQEFNMNNQGLVGPVTTSTGMAITPPPPVQVSCRPRMLRTGMQNTTGGKYLGTLCTLSALWAGAQAMGNLYSVNVYPSTVRVRARNVDTPGRVGPAHIIRYDGLGIGQQIAFAGTQWLQGIALGNLAPFIGSNGQTFTVPDNIFSKFVELLWALSPLYRRIMSLEEYDKVIKPYFRDLTINDLMGSIDRLDEASHQAAVSLGRSGGFIPQIAGSMASAGLGSAAQRVGEMLGGRVGGEVASCAVRNIADRAIGLGGAAGAYGQYPVRSDGRGGSYLELGGASGSVRRNRSQ